ncbi:MAG: hypothetical protein H7A51_15055 [Akkermansiaceae bacterium]|nr:hypothetical protein [Akkermansiaceae bacterium]
MSNKYSATAFAEQHNEPTLLGIEPARNAVFPDPATRPSIRAWNSWRSKNFYPYVKIGKRVWIDPVQARKALEARFTIEAI